MVTEHLLQAEFGLEAEPIVETVPAPKPDLRLIEQINDVVFKLRSFTESSDGDVGYGIELGMQRAADMIENVLSHISKENDVG